jgi:hypothetical protein
MKYGVGAAVFIVCYYAYHCMIRSIYFCKNDQAIEFCVT